jgi:gas vesicle protein
MNDDYSNGYSNGGNGTLGSIIAFSAGALVGAGVALILTPQSGAETRKLVRDYAAKAVDEVLARIQDGQAAVKTALEPGKEAFEAAKEYGKQAYETGKEAVKGAGKEIKTQV